ncbi:hypothetical protein LX87_03814 [Larkinella arboricola]|uniref:Uncharacterized protein n=1 Tax=Larkinella arboricola TaxID=643671 RepID=A0A327WUN8_LARAB|nr:hypothetical protein [Larkinella arboricola]RAJ96064.1 hypothetical protein LX87_03814 [Larkinella arboricola]
MVQPVTDEMLLEAPADPSIRYYIPRYKLATQRVDLQQQFRVSLEQFIDADGGQLIVFLAKFPAPAIENAVINARQVEVQPSIAIEFKVDAITKMLAFTEVDQQADEIKAVLKVTSFAEFNQLFQALTTSSYETKLVVNSLVSLAYPANMPVDINQLNPETHRPKLVLKGLEEYEVRGNWFNRASLSVRNREIYPDELFQPSPDLPPCGLNTNSSRTWVDIYNNLNQRIYGFCALNKADNLDDLWVAFQKGQPMPVSVYIALNDRRKGQQYFSTEVALRADQITSGERLYVNAKESFSSRIDFVFPETLHSYMYRKAGGHGPGRSGFIKHTVVWEEKEYTYFQDEARPDHFLYLPDSYKLAQVEGPVRVPWLRVDFEGKTLSDLKARIQYRLAGFVDLQRIQDAAKKLINKVEGETVEGLVFELLDSADEATYKLTLPGVGGSSDRPDAIIDPGNYIEDALPALSIDDFRTVFNLLLSTDERDITLRGQVNLKLGGLLIPPIPVSIRLGDSAGDVFDSTRTVDAAAGTIAVSVKNAIESPVSVQGLNVEIQADKQFVPARAEGDGLVFPRQIAAGETVVFTVVPETPLADLQAAEVILDWQNLDILPDSAALYDAIVSKTVNASFEKAVTIKVHAFGDDPTILDIGIKFKSSETGPVLTSTTFSRPQQVEEDQLMQTVGKAINLPLPLQDYVRNLPTFGQYWYQITVYRTSGDATGVWTLESSDFINITTDKLPVPVIG